MIRDKKILKQHLKDLDFIETEIGVYLSLVELGEAPASIIAKSADLPRTTAISILEKFRSKNLVSTHKYKGVTYYWVESPRLLSESFSRKAGTAMEVDKLLSGLYRSGSPFPSGEIYDTRSSIRTFIDKVLTNLPQKTIIYTIDTPGEGNYQKIYTEQIEKKVIELKKKKSIHTHTLVPHGTAITINTEKLSAQNIRTRELPKGVEFKGSLWIVGDKIVHFSGNPPFVVSFEHKQLIVGIKNIFDFFWETARKNL